jgi:hypothetical protein
VQPRRAKSDRKRLRRPPGVGCHLSLGHCVTSSSPARSKNVSPCRYGSARDMRPPSSDLDSPTSLVRVDLQPSGSYIPSWHLSVAMRVSCALSTTLVRISRTRRGITGESPERHRRRRQNAADAVMSGARWINVADQKRGGVEADLWHQTTSRVPPDQPEEGERGEMDSGSLWWTPNIQPPTSNGPAGVPLALLSGLDRAW